MNERIHFFIKIYISHTLFSIGWCFCCVWEMSWRRGQIAILTPSSSSIIAALLSHLGWVAQPRVTEGRKALNLQAGSHAGILSPPVLNRPGHLFILLSHAHLLPLFLPLFTQVHLLIDGSVEGQYITKGNFSDQECHTICLIAEGERNGKKNYSMKKLDGIYRQECPRCFPFLYLFRGLTKKLNRWISILLCWIVLTN